MLDFRTVLFDLDGTLSDPALGITNSLIHALASYGIRVKDRRELFPFIGPPLFESFQRYYAFSPEQARQAVDRYREYFSDRGLYENELYPGIDNLLSDLSAAGIRLYLATSKPEIYARTILEHFAIDRFFAVIAGSHLDGRRTDKAEVIAHALSIGGASSQALAVMVGDRSHDILGAHANGLPAIGVLYGYGSKQELADAGADHLADSVADLRALLTPR